MSEKRYQMYHRYNHKFTPPLEERICVWFEWSGPITPENQDQFQEAKTKAFTRQIPLSWRNPFSQKQKDNIALGEKYSPELAWSTIMEDGDGGEANTPVFNR